MSFASSLKANLSFKKTPPPLCDFMQWLDLEQSDDDKRYVEETGRSARERWLRMVEAEKQDENARSSRRKFTFVGRLRNVKRPRPVKQTERGRGRGLAGPRKLGRMPSGRGNTPVVLSRHGVLDLECITQKPNLFFMYPMNFYPMNSVGCAFSKSLPHANSYPTTRVCFLRVTTAFPFPRIEGPTTQATSLPTYMPPFLLRYIFTTSSNVFLEWG